MINIKNVIENLIYIIVIGLIVVGATTMCQLRYQKIIEVAIEKQTTEITNQIGKIKGKKSYIPVDMTNQVVIDSTGTTTNKKNGWWFFGRKNRN